VDSNSIGYKRANELLKMMQFLGKRRGYELVKSIKVTPLDSIDVSWTLFQGEKFIGKLILEDITNKWSYYGL